MLYLSIGQSLVSWSVVLTCASLIFKIGPSSEIHLFLKFPNILFRKIGFRELTCFHRFGRGDFGELGKMDCEAQCEILFPFAFLL